MEEVFATIIHERCLLMARAKSIAVCQCPELGEEIYSCWTQTMDASNNNDFDLTGYIDELACKYQVGNEQVSKLFETIRLIIIQYDKLIDSVDS
ncbi:MAG: hypothetical protein ACR2LR_09515 [Hassallia sp.]